jgi:hypothetical protein
MSFAGYSTTTSSQCVPLAGRLSLITQTYVWVKTYLTSDGSCYITGIALKSDESILALAGSNGRNIFIFFVNPLTGSKKLNYFYKTFDYEIEIKSSTILFGGQNRLYLTGELAYK